MAIGMILEVPGGSQKQYDQVMKELDLRGKLPNGALYHCAGPTDGGWRVFDVWESKETFERFYNERLRKAIEKTGMPQARPAFFNIYNTLTSPEVARR